MIRALLGLALAVAAGGLAHAQFAGTENFSSALGSNWAAASTSPLGANGGYSSASLAQTAGNGGTLGWTVASNTGSGENGATSLLAWTGNLGSHTQDWALTLNVNNSYTPITSQERVGIGLQVWNTADNTDYLRVILQQTAYATPSSIFHSFFVTDNSFFSLGDSSPGVGSAGTVGLNFNSTTKVLTTLYNTGGGWVQIGSFGIAGSGGTSNQNWNMTSGSSFSVGLYGIASVVDNGAPLTISAGIVYADNFTLTTTSAIPEPSTYTAAAGALALGLALLRRRQHATAAT